MNHDREAIGKYIYEISFHANHLFYDKDGAFVNYKPWYEISEFETFENEDTVIKKFYFSLTDYYIKYYLRDIEFRMFDEIIESTSIFFSKVHGYTIPTIQVTKEIEREGFAMALFDKSWDGYNWEFLIEVSVGKDEVDKLLFRNIAKDFLINTLNFDIPKPIDKFDVE